MSVPHEAALVGKTAVVTGSTRGIGLEIARAYLELGAQVVVNGQTERSIENAAKSLGGGNPWLGVAADLQSADGPARLVSTAVQRFGGIDVLVNNAGVVDSADAWTIDAVGWDRVMAVNLRAAFFCAREAAKAMKSANRTGVIINVSSVAAQTGGTATGPAYVASKAGLIGLTRSLARQFGPIGVRVNCIAPADIETSMTATWSDDLRQRLIGITPLGRFGQATEVAAAAVFLASPASSFVTGQTINVNGGIYMN